MVWQMMFDMLDYMCISHGSCHICGIQCGDLLRSMCNSHHNCHACGIQRLFDLLHYICTAHDSSYSSIIKLASLCASCRPPASLFLGAQNGAPDALDSERPACVPSVSWPTALKPSRTGPSKSLKRPSRTSSLCRCSLRTSWTTTQRSRWSSRRGWTPTYILL